MKKISLSGSPALLFFLLTLLASAPSACVLFDPLIPVDEDGGAGDAGEDAPTAECEAGASLTAACGNCGTSTMTCLHGDWEYGPCLGEGVCTWGTVGTCGTGQTGTQECSSSCTWGPCTVTPVAPAAP